MKSNRNIWCWAGSGKQPDQKKFGTKVHITNIDSGQLVIRTAQSANNIVTVMNNGSWLLFDGIIWNLDQLVTSIYNSRDSKLISSSSYLKTVMVLEYFLEQMIYGGLDALANLNADFTLIYWDTFHKKLIAVRDRFGSRTIYWKGINKAVTFASRMEALIDEQPKLNLVSAVDFLVDGFTDQGDKTLFEGINQIPPGCAIELDFTNNYAFKIHKIRWYRPPAPSQIISTLDDSVIKFRELLRDSVSLRYDMKNSNHIGLMLSGGIDSSSIAAILSDHLDNNQIKTFKVNFGSPHHDLISNVNMVVATTNAIHNSIQFSSKALFSYRDEILTAIEMPFERSIISAHWLLCKLISENDIDTTIDGVGADEQLGGYRPFQDAYQAFIRFKNPKYLTFVGSSRSLDEFNLEQDKLPKFYNWLSPQLIDLAIDKHISDAKNQKFPRYHTANPWTHDTPINSLGELCRFHTQNGVLPMLLRYNREIGFAFNQNSYSPFLDHRLVEFSITLKDEIKVHKGVTKAILRKAMKGSVPDQIIRNDNKQSYLQIECSLLFEKEYSRLQEGVKRAYEDFPELFSRIEKVDICNKYDKSSLLKMWRVDCFAAWLRLFNVNVSN